MVTNATLGAGDDVYIYINRADPNGKLMGECVLSALLTDADFDYFDFDVVRGIFLVISCSVRRVSGSVITLNFYIYILLTFSFSGWLSIHSDGNFGTSTPLISTAGSNDITCANLESSPGTSLNVPIPTSANSVTVSGLTSASPSPSTQLGSNNPNPNTSKSKLSNTQVLAIAIGVVVPVSVVTLGALIGLCIWRKRRARKASGTKMYLDGPDTPKYSPSSFGTGDIQTIMPMECATTHSRDGSMDPKAPLMPSNIAGAGLGMRMGEYSLYDSNPNSNSSISVSGRMTPMMAPFSSQTVTVTSASSGGMEMSINERMTPDQVGIQHQRHQRQFSYNSNNAAQPASVSATNSGAITSEQLNSTQITSVSATNVNSGANSGFPRKLTLANPSPSPTPISSPAPGAAVFQHADAGYVHEIPPPYIDRSALTPIRGSGSASASGQPLQRR